MTMNNQMFPHDNKPERKRVKMPGKVMQANRQTKRLFAACKAIREQGCHD